MALDPVTAVLDIGSKLIDRIFPDKEKRDAAQLELLKLQQAGELQKIAGQMNINAIEAANPNIFVSGWRPGAGWVCVAGLAISFVVGPLVTWGSRLAGHPVDFPQLDMATLLTLLGGMLGLGTLRTTEKINGVAAK